jgi:hypothetical protein
MKIRTYGLVGGANSEWTPVAEVNLGKKADKSTFYINVRPKSEIKVRINESITTLIHSIDLSSLSYDELANIHEGIGKLLAAHKDLADDSVKVKVTL